VSSDLKPKAWHDVLVNCVRDAMTIVEPEALTTDELQAIVDILEPAMDREPVDSGRIVPIVRR
jgi:hypothetical protein